MGRESKSVEKLRATEACGHRKELLAHLNVGHICRGQQAYRHTMVAVTAGGPEGALMESWPGS